MWGRPWVWLCGTSARKDLCMVPCHCCHIYGICTSRTGKVWGMLKNHQLGVAMEVKKAGLFHGSHYVILLYCENLLHVMNWIVFVVWLTNERRRALFPGETIVRDPHHHESPTRRQQGLNLRRTWARLSWMKLWSSDNRYTTAPLGISVIDFIGHLFSLYYYCFICLSLAKPKVQLSVS